MKLLNFIFFFLKKCNSQTRSSFLEQSHQNVNTCRVTFLNKGPLTYRSELRPATSCANADDDGVPCGIDFAKRTSQHF